MYGTPYHNPLACQLSSRLRSSVLPWENQHASGLSHPASVLERYTQLLVRLPRDECASFDVDRELKAYVPSWPSK